MLLSEDYLSVVLKGPLILPIRSEPLVSRAIQIYEIYKVVRRDLNEERAIEGVSALKKTTIEPLGPRRSLEAHAHTCTSSQNAR